MEVKPNKNAEKTPSFVYFLINLLNVSNQQLSSVRSNIVYFEKNFLY